MAAAVPVFLRSCARFLLQKDDAWFQAAPGPVDFGRIGDWRPLCRAAEGLPAGGDEAARHFFEAGFVPLAVADYGGENGLFTGYFEIELHGARRPSRRFRTPIYRRPTESALATRYSRAEIDRGALAKRGLELLWVDDPVDAFFLHVQGSGAVHLTDGSVVRVGYDGQNGRAYVPVGRLLVERGEIARDKLTMATIRAWMMAHRAAGERLREENPSYVFFREIRGDGPVGAEQVVLTAQRSLAVDPAYLPFGVPLWLDAAARYPPARAWQRLLIAQDSGGAIKGPVRGDLYWGGGAAAGREAGAMNALGRYFVLLPHAVADRKRAAD